MAMGSSFDQIGPFAKTVEDAQIVFDFIVGHDEMDSTSIDPKPNQNLVGQQKIKIGIPKEALNIEGLNPEMVENFNKAVEKFKKLGYKIQEISLPNLSYSLAVYYTLIPAEVSSNLARFDGVRYGLHVDGANNVDDYFKTKQAGFGPEVKRRIILGTYVLSSGYYDAYYNKANIVRDLIKEDYKKAFEEVDIIITPTTPGPAFKIGEKINNPLQIYLEDIFTVPANLAGIPAISVPCGFKEINGKKLPLGLQLFAGQGQEGLLFAVAKSFENK